MSLHQPGPSLFAMLDQVLLLAKGRTAYYGAPADAPAAFARLGAPMPAHSTIAEHMLHTVSDEALWPAIRQALDAGAVPADEAAPPPQGPPLQVPRSGPGLLRELAVVFWRSSADVVRNPLLGTFHALIGLVSGILVGFIFFRVGGCGSGSSSSGRWLCAAVLLRRRW
jgi:hypothetical protein